MKKYSIRLAAIFLGICVLSFAVSAIPSISVDGEQTIDVGLTNRFNIILSEAPNGLSGYKINVSLVNASLGEITSIDFPSWASVNSKGSLPSDSVLIKAVDISNQIQNGANNIILATVNVRRDDKGNISLNIIEQLDDDNGNLITNIDSNNVQSQSSSIMRYGQTSANISMSDGQTAVSSSKDVSDKISTNDLISSTSVPANISSQENGTKSQQETSGFQIIIALLGLVAASSYRRI